MTVHEACRAAILRLQERADAFFRQAFDAGGMSCGPGCTACCRVDLAVFRVEAEVVAEAFARLSARVRAAAARRAAAGMHCAMLSSRGRCIVYEARPIICRTQGLAILVDGRVDHCPLNYRDREPAREHVLVLERLNEPLALAEILGGGKGERVRLADVALRLGGLRAPRPAP